MLDIPCSHPHTPSPKRASAQESTEFLRTLETSICHSASTAHRKPVVPARSMLGAIKRYLPCSSSRRV
jgi:hypothetical protein